MTTEMTAVSVVNALLEAYNPYDMDDPLDLPEFPGGFIARAVVNGHEERFEVKLSNLAGKPAYHWVKYWWDDYRNKLLPLDMGHYPVTRGDAQNYIEQSAKKYSDYDWRIEFI